MVYGAASRKLKLMLVVGRMLTFPELVAIFRSQLLAEWYTSFAQLRMTRMYWYLRSHHL